MADGRYDYLTGEGAPSGVDIANELTASFVPGLNMAQALRDYRKAFKDKDVVGGITSMLGLIPGMSALTKGGALAGTAAKAMFVPALLRQMDPKKYAEARALPTPEELWKEMGLSRAPSRPKDEPGVASYLEEIVDNETTKYKPDVPLMNWASKQNYINKNFSPLQRQGAEYRASNLDLPKPGVYQVGDLIEHPELFKRFPELQKGRVNISDAYDKQNRGSYSPRSGDVNLNLHPFLNADEIGGGTVGTLLHELTHKLQHKYDLPGGTSKAAYVASPTVWARLENQAADPQFQQNMGPEAMRHVSNLLRYKGGSGFKAYKNAPGEKYAREAQERFGLPPEARRAVDPNKYGLKGAYDEPDPDFSYGVLKLIDTMGATGMDLGSLPEMLRHHRLLK